MQRHPDNAATVMDHQQPVVEDYGHPEAGGAVFEQGYCPSLGGGEGFGDPTPNRFQFTPGALVRQIKPVLVEGGMG
jgi:hypothetical protein